MNRFFIFGAVGIAIVLSLFFIVSSPETQDHPEAASRPEKDVPITALPIRKKSNEIGTDKSSEISETKKDETNHTSAFSSAPVGEDETEYEQRLNIEEMKALSYRKREEEARKKGPEALERFYEREKDLARRKARMEKLRKANDAYFEAKQEWMAQMAKARKEKDVAKIMELEKNRPVPPMLKKKNPEEER